MDFWNVEVGSFRCMSTAPQNGFREWKVYHNFVLILYTKPQILYTIPSTANSNSNLGAADMQPPQMQF